MRRWLLLPLVWCSLHQTAAADGSPQDWLGRMSQAFRQENYQGVLIYGDSRQWETMAVVHGFRDGVEYEKLHHLTGIPREIIRHGDHTTFIHPGEHGVPLNTSLPAPLQGYKPSTDAAGYYDFRLGGVSRVAGRYARELDVTPRDEHRYGYRLWLDQESGLLLRSDMLDQAHQVLERFQFADVDIGEDIPISAFEPEADGHVRAQPPAAMRPDAGADVVPGWVPAWVPGGFEMTAANTLAEAGATAEQEKPLRLMYSDGLAAFTVFVDAVPAEPLPEMVSQWGATAAVVRYRQHDDHKYRVTAVGELPAVTMTRIAASVIYREKEE